MTLVGGTAVPFGRLSEVRALVAASLPSLPFLAPCRKRLESRMVERMPLASLECFKAECPGLHKEIVEPALTAPRFRKFDKRDDSAARLKFMPESIEPG